MEINTNTMCCATAEIHELSEHDSPEDAMRAFIEETCYYSNFDKYPAVHLTKAHPQNVSAFYYFTGIMAYRGSKSKETYGQEFAAFIKKEKLGSVNFGGKAYNRMNNPDHLIGVWVWRPSLRGLNAYIKRNKITING